MTTSTLRFALAAMHAFSLLASSAKAELTLSDVIDPGRGSEATSCKEYRDSTTIVLADGFWAKDVLYLSMAVDRLGAPGDGMILGVTERDTPCPSSNLYSGYDQTESTEKTSVRAGINQTPPNPVDLYGVTGILIDEIRDNPCVIRLYGRTVDPRYGSPGTDRVLGELRLNSCEEWIPGGPLNPRWLIFKGPDNRFVRGLQVCLGSKEVIPATMQLYPTKIKGLRILPAAVAETGRVEPREQTLAFELPNCEIWVDVATCTETQIVTGVDVYVYRGNRFSGLALQCESVEARTAPATMIKDDTGF